MISERYSGPTGPASAQEGALFYHRPNFRYSDGSDAGVLFKGTVPVLSVYHDMNNTFSSMRVSASCRAYLYDAENFEGTPILVQQGGAIADLTQVGMNDKTSSIKVFCDPPTSVPAGFKAFVYASPPLEVHSTALGKSVALGKTRFDEPYDSVVLELGCTAKLYADSDFGVLETTLNEGDESEGVKAFRSIDVSCDGSEAEAEPSAADTAVADMIRGMMSDPIAPASGQPWDPTLAAHAGASAPAPYTPSTASSSVPALIEATSASSSKSSNIMLLVLVLCVGVLGFVAYSATTKKGRAGNRNR